MATLFIKSILLLLSSSLIVSLAIIVNADNGFVGGISGKSFSLISRVKAMVFENGSSTCIYNAEFYEFYSAEQKRAKIEFKSKYSTNSTLIDHHGIWYVDSERELALEYDKNTLQCLPSNIQSVNFNSHLPQLEEMSGGEEKHVVGTGKLLLFIEKHSELFKASSEVEIRNLDCVTYEMNYVTAKEDKFIFFVYYDKLSFLSNKRGATPMRIFINTGKQVTIIDFLQVRQLPMMANTPQTSNEALTSGLSSIEFDHFMFKHVAGCSVALQGDQINLFFNQTASQATRFSFEAYLEVESGHRSNEVASSKTFVAYDASVKSMRVDISAYHGLQMPDTRFKRQVLNLELDRMYHTIERNTGDESKLGRYKLVASPGRQCVVTELMGLTYLQRSTIGQLLVGADKFVYMGLADVRGIRAKVYEASGGSLPYWLDQPILYMSNVSQKLELRHLYCGVDQSDNELNISRNILVYLSEQNSANQPLLLIEVYTVDTTLNRYEILDKKSIHIHNFVWELTESSDGDRGSELFSLRDSCTDFNDGASARIEMLLEGDEILKPYDSYSQIFDNNLRNLALVSSFQKRLRLPASMVFDLESKVVKSTQSQRQMRDFIKLAVNFNVAAHTRSKAELFYLGQGRLGGARVFKFHRSFKDCFELVAYERAPVYFGFNQTKKLCYVDFRPITSNNSLDGPDGKRQAFKLIHSAGPLELYRVEHSVDLKQEYYFRWIREVSAEEADILGINLRLPNLTKKPAEDLIFVIKSVKKEFDNQALSANNNASDRDLASTNVITGFGLLEFRKGNRRVQPASLNDQNLSPVSQDLKLNEKSAMSFDQCHAACLADFDCQSFSVCIRNSDFECVISEISFKSVSVLKQLKNLQTKTPTATLTKLYKRANSTVTITLDDGQQTVVKLARHLNCELHNKNYMELFAKGKYTRQNLQNRLARAVKSRATCAEMCFLNNIEILKKDVSHIGEVSLLFISETDIAKIDTKTLTNAIDKHKQAVQQLCTGFYYLDAQQLPIGKDFDSKIREFMLADGDNMGPKETSGYCFIEDFMKNGSSTNYSKEIFQTLFNLEFHDFKTDVFYEKQYGFSLHSSPLSKAQANAYREIRWEGNKASEASYSTLSLPVKQSFNFQQFIFSNPSNCAKACFTQSNGPWPACRSFDVLIIDGITWCHLNSVTVRQVLATGKRELMYSPNCTQAWHYEPRAGFVSDELVLSREVELAEKTLITRFRIASLKFQFHFLGSFIIVVIGLISGIFLNVWLGGRLSSKHNPRHQSSLANTLVDTPSIVDL